MKNTENPPLTLWWRENGFTLTDMPGGLHFIVTRKGNKDGIPNTSLAADAEQSAVQFAFSQSQTETD